MQNTYDLKPEENIKKELAKYPGRFINIVDYNIGVEKEHLLKVAALLKKSEAIGWMAEMCLESLDDDEVLQALRDSRCKMIYCGLESIDEASLKSINKSKTNRLDNYERIIRKAQTYGVQVAAGVILGLEGATQQSFDETFLFFSKMGIIYSKLTFLTYNPGTKVKESMRNKGTYITEELSKFDGNHLTFLANDVSENELHQSAKSYIKRFYSLRNIIGRSSNSGLSGLARLEFILFNLCYRKVYVDWLTFDVLDSKNSQFRKLIEAPFKKSLTMRFFEKLLKWAGNKNYKKSIRLINSQIARSENVEEYAIN
jgi:radical SAM superfamily enzyme YgiQ (UPF0313 family)